jgi:hypothetical protein
LTDIQRSPYRERIIAVIDSVHGAGLRQALVTMGLPDENVIVWSNNGIEYVYPEEILSAIYGSGGQLQIQGDQITRNGITYSKAELCDKVCSRLGVGTEMSQEFEGSFLELVKKRVG